jgi:hypothetical protein
MLPTISASDLIRATLRFRQKCRRRLKYLLAAGDHAKEMRTDQSHHFVGFEEEYA